MMIRGVWGLWLAAVCLAGGDLPVKGVRLSFFILDEPMGPSLVSALQTGQAMVWKGDKTIGRFMVVDSAGSRHLCRLVSGEIHALDSSCTVRVPDPISKIKTVSAISPSLPNHSPGVSLPLPPTDSVIRVGQTVFRKWGSGYLSEKRFSFVDFQTLDKLNAFLARLMTESNQAFLVSIPSEGQIRENEREVRRMWVSGFYLCLVSGRLGYCRRADDGALTFKNLLADTLEAMAEKFHFYLMAQK